MVDGVDCASWLRSHRATFAALVLIASGLTAGAAVFPIFQPGGELFALICLVLIADVAGNSLQKLTGAPPLLGFMIVSCL